MIYLAYTNADVALTASSTKTVLSATLPATYKGEVLGFSIGFDASSAAAGIRVELVEGDATTAGASSAATVTVMKSGPGTPVAFAGTVAQNYTVEPTVLTVKDVVPGVQQTSGLYVQYPLGERPTLQESHVIALRVITPAGVTPNCRAGIRFGNGTT